MSGTVTMSRLGAVASILFATAAINPGIAADLAEPRVFSSVSGVLDILMVAKPAKLPLPPFTPTGWVYDICQRSAAIGNACPPTAANLYGGTRLQLQQGDTLKIRLVNKLPPAVQAKHQLDAGLKYLRLNPTNLHTHGMLVSTHFPTVENPTYGDTVFVLTLNPANGRPADGSHIHGDVRLGYTDYAIKIPRHHPSGLFWFHPHVHGISLNQISAGMAGIITVGDPSDYICTSACGLPDGIPLRHMILKDTEVLPPNTLIDQEDPAFCDFNRAATDPPRLGSCLAPSGQGTGNQRGHWFFTVNGQIFPTIPVAAPTGEIWRITNASASVTYNLVLSDFAEKRNMTMQVVSIDGVSVRPNPGTTASVFNEVGGLKFDVVTCPAATARPAAAPEPLCVSRLVMFPSSRVELWVTYRDATGVPVSPPPGAHAIFRTVGMETGPAGDAWPQVQLARTEFIQTGARPAMPPTLTVQGEAQALMRPVQLASDLAESSKAFPATPDCKPLAPGHKRRIFLNSIFHGFVPTRVETGPENPFGLAYEEIDAAGNPVPRTFVDLAVFNPDTPTICVTLGPGNTPTTERWELINLAGEDHNFHIHQVKFSLVSKDAVGGTGVPRGSGVLHDNVPVRHSSGGFCFSVQDWRNGICTAHPVTIEVPFTVAGDFVYHCHILEHEDGGMMARIRVRR